MTHHRRSTSIHDDAGFEAALLRTGRSASWHLTRLEDLRLEYHSARAAANGCSLDVGAPASTPRRPQRVEAIQGPA
jgi:hypothetical protein